MNFDYDLADPSDALAFEKLAKHVGRSYCKDMGETRLAEVNPNELARKVYIDYAKADVKWISDHKKAEQIWIESFTHAFGKVREARTTKVTLEDFFNDAEVSRTPRR